jgi:hypothetical protein
MRPQALLVCASSAFAAQAANIDEFNQIHRLPDIGQAFLV